MAIHLVVDNYAIHKHPGVKQWLAAHPRYQVHYTPIYASWLNQVEIWFNIFINRAISRGTFKNVKDLIAKIEQFVVECNCNSHPFLWIATADSILEKAKRLCQRNFCDGTLPIYLLAGGRRFRPPAVSVRTSIPYRCLVTCCL